MPRLASCAHRVQIPDAHGFVVVNRPHAGVQHFIVQLVQIHLLVEDNVPGQNGTISGLFLLLSSYRGGR